MSALGLTIVAVGVGLGLLVLLSILFAGSRTAAQPRSHAATQGKQCGGRWKRLQQRNVERQQRGLRRWWR